MVKSKTPTKKKAAKKRASKYEKKLAVNVGFEELLAISLAPKKAKS